MLDRTQANYEAVLFPEHIPYTATASLLDKQPQKIAMVMNDMRATIAFRKNGIATAQVNRIYSPVLFPTGLISVERRSHMQTFTQKQNPPQKQVSSILTRAKTETRKARHPEHPILHLHRVIGNQAVQRMLQRNTEELEVGMTATVPPRFGHDFSRVRVHSSASVAIQPKLAINPPGDLYEQQADRVSERVMQMPESQRQESIGEAEAQTTPAQLGQATLPPSVHEVLREPGEPLAPATRALMEPRFGHNFAHVRVHTTPRGVESAEAVNALAYTAGNHVVFGAGQYAPGSPQGQRLLAHELTHVVQQNDGLHGGLAPAISRAPVRLMPRKGPLSDAEEQEEERRKEAPKNLALQHHQDQQQKIAGFLENARKIQPDPKKGLRDPDTLFHNTVGLLDGGKLTLTVLSPTHFDPNLHFDRRVRFDAQGNHFGGDYSGVLEDKTSAAGKILPPTSNPLTIQTLPPKVERVPGEKPPPEGTPAPTPASAPAVSSGPVEVAFFTRGLDTTEGEFKNTFVHEGQHVADLSPQELLANNPDDKIKVYQSEFRAFWIQPPRPRVGMFAPESIDRLPEPTGKAENSNKVSIAKPEDCKSCKPANASAPSEVKTQLKNPRQEAIFWYIMTHYQAHEYDCCYVYNDKFRKEVNAFAYPESVNLINSDRLIDLNLEVQKLNSTMKLAEVNGTQLVILLTRLDALDWTFLNDPKLSKPFWEALKATAPKFVYNGIAKLAKKATKSPFSAADIKKVL